MSLSLIFSPTPPSHDACDDPSRRGRRLRITPGEQAPAVEELEKTATAHNEHRVLLERLRAGDTTALETLHAQYWDSLVRFAARHAGEYDVADEIVQDVFLDLWRRRATVDVRGSLRSYLFGATYRRARHVARAARRAGQHERIGSLYIQAERADASLSAQPDATIRMAELEAVVHSTIDALPERCREIFLLYQAEALSVTEIAEACGVAPATVRVQVHRAMTTLWRAVEMHLR